MTKPANPAMTEDVVHSDETSMSQNFFITNLILPLKSEITTVASLVEGVNFLLLHS